MVGREGGDEAKRNGLWTSAPSIAHNRGAKEPGETSPTSLSHSYRLDLPLRRHTPSGVPRACSQSWIILAAIL